MSDRLSRTGTPARPSTLRRFLQDQLWPARMALIVAGAIALAGIALIILLNRALDISFSTLIMDTFAVSGDPIYTGLFSNMGIAVWIVAATIWGLAYLLAGRYPLTRWLRPLALASLILSLLLLADDALMIHEWLIEQQGLPEVPLSVVYVLFVAGYLAVAWRALPRTAYLSALISGLLLGASMLIDILMLTSSTQLLIEDSLKFAGIVFWAAYAISVFQQVGRPAGQDR